MLTATNSDNFSISLTEILPDHDDPTRLELSFSASLTPAYLRSLPFDPADFELFFADIDDCADTDVYLTYDLNVASRHDDRLYYEIDQSGDLYDDLETAVYAFGQPIIDYIATACQLLNVPFFPND